MESRKATEKEVKGPDVAQWLEGLPGMHEAWALSLVEIKGKGEKRRRRKRRVEGRVDDERP